MIGLGANNGVSKEVALKIKTAPHVLQYFGIHIFIN